MNFRCTGLNSMTVFSLEALIYYYYFFKHSFANCSVTLPRFSELTRRWRAHANKLFSAGSPQWLIQKNTLTQKVSLSWIPPARNHTSVPCYVGGCLPNTILPSKIHWLCFQWWKSSFPPFFRSGNLHTFKTSQSLNKISGHCFYFPQLI